MNHWCHTYGTKVTGVTRVAVESHGDLDRHQESMGRSCFPTIDRVRQVRKTMVSPSCTFGFLNFGHYQTAALGVRALGCGFLGIGQRTRAFERLGFVPVKKHHLHEEHNHQNRAKGADDSRPGRQVAQY
jgi:hypothetical protein